jgi:hypothetical protein
MFALSLAAGYLVRREACVVIFVLAEFGDPEVEIFAVIMRL